MLRNSSVAISWLEKPEHHVGVVDVTVLESEVDDNRAARMSIDERGEAKADEGTADEHRDASTSALGAHAPRALVPSARQCEYTDMSSVTHPHPVDAAGVEQAQSAGLGAIEADQLGRLLALLSDPVRLRVLFCLVSVDELCVGDLALALDISMDQSSYALKLLRGAGLVQSRRDGRVMHYRLADGFPHQLLDHCLRQLLSIAAEEGRS